MLIHRSAASIYHKADEKAAYELEIGESSWGIMNKGILHHTNNFPDLQETLKVTNDLTVLEVAGAGQLLVEIQEVYGGKNHVSVSLADTLSSDSREVADEYGIKHISGNLLFEETWDEIRKQRYSLIVVRPCAGYSYFPSTIKSYFIAFRNLLNVLTENGTIYIQLPPFLCVNGLWFDYLIPELIKNGLEISPYMVEAWGEDQLITSIKITKCNYSDMDTERLGQLYLEYLKRSKNQEQ